MTVLDSITWSHRLTSNERSHCKSSVLKKLLISLKFITGRIVQVCYLLQVAQKFLKNKAKNDTSYGIYFNLMCCATIS